MENSFFASIGRLLVRKTVEAAAGHRVSTTQAGVAAGALRVAAEVEPHQHIPPNGVHSVCCQNGRGARHRAIKISEITLGLAKPSQACQLKAQAGGTDHSVQKCPWPNQCDMRLVQAQALNRHGSPAVQFL